jgi:hypothetical protein
MHVPVPRRPFMIMRKTAAQAAQQELRSTIPEHIHTPEQVGRGLRRAQSRPHRYAKRCGRGESLPPSRILDEKHFSATPIFNMRKKPTSQSRLGFAIVRLRRFVGRDVLPILIRPFEGAAEERPLTNGLTQIAGTLRTMGVQPDDSVVKQIGSEFEALFCASAAPDKLNARLHRSPIDPAKVISDLIREPPRQSAAAAALQRFITFCKRRIITRMRRSFL